MQVTPKTNDLEAFTTMASEDYGEFQAEARPSLPQLDQQLRAV